MTTYQLIDGNFPEAGLDVLVRHVKCGIAKKELLLELLSLRHPLYQGRSSRKVNRMRGYMLAPFEQLGLPELGLVMALEELENSFDPYIVAAAAKAVRGSYSIPAQLSSILQIAIYNIAYTDEAISFESYWPATPLSNYTTALHEILYTFQWLKQHATDQLFFLEKFSTGAIININTEMKQLAMETIAIVKKSKTTAAYNCCEVKEQSKISHDAVQLTAVRKIMLQDQDGNTLSFNDFFGSTPSLIAFFYTRCDNPNKCALTVSKLGEVQQLIKEMQLDGINIAAITYDPHFDQPERLKLYFKKDELTLDAHTKAFRVLNNEFDVLNEYLKLQVNFNSSIVNQHRIELFVVDAQTRVIKEFSGMQWNPKDVAEFLKTNFCSTKKQLRFRKAKKTAFVMLNGMLTLLFVFLPKCPACLAVYLSAFGISGMSWWNSLSSYRLVLVLLVCINLVVLYYRGKVGRSYLPFILALTGTILLTITKVMDWNASFTYMSVALILIASFLNVRSFSGGLRYRPAITSLNYFFSRIKNVFVQSV